MTIREIINENLELLAKMGEDFASIALFRENWLDSSNVFMVIFVAFLYWGIFAIAREIIKEKMLHRKRYKTEPEYREKHDLAEEKARKSRNEKVVHKGKS